MTHDQSLYRSILLSIFLCIVQTTYAQPDVLNGYSRKIAGEEINYFSHFHQFAKTAMLTRVNGNMPISWEAPTYKGDASEVSYSFLMGHSTGTSNGDRHFDVMLNGQFLFTITTPMKRKDMFIIDQNIGKVPSFRFTCEEYDINGDAFGKLLITLPAAMVKENVEFTIRGQNENSRDWLMIFMYESGLKVIAEPTNLVLRSEGKRQLNLYIDNPYPNNTVLELDAEELSEKRILRHGYNKLSIPAYTASKTGFVAIRLIVNKTDTVIKVMELKPIRDFHFHIIHHSHNDIGYSHLQPEVAKIQNENIRKAMRWIQANPNPSNKPIWHIESLWAVENFLNGSTSTETTHFADAVRKGQIVLSANYANILTGLCRTEELNWVLEYAKKLEKRFGFTIRNAMITDIPGISYAGLLSYVNNDIPYLSLGPNYVHTLPDHGDRVGSFVKEQGDRIFYWQPNATSGKKVMVWTAGKGYSYFHGIGAGEKQAAWESRVSAYCEELQQKNYPFNLVQLRYTQHSDNGPVDTTLHQFVEDWNTRYSVPHLRISSLDTLFAEMEKRHADAIPTYSGELSPYWEDGAYSTAKEEMDNRDLVTKTIALEKYARKKKQYEPLAGIFYRLHRAIVLFHEHTWGAWCSISDPELPFTTKQWEIKKQFLDSATYYYQLLSKRLSFIYQPEIDSSVLNHLPISDFDVDAKHGGLFRCVVSGKNIIDSSAEYDFFEPIYSRGINPSTIFNTTNVTITEKENSKARKVIQVNASLPSLNDLKIIYTLDKIKGILTCKCSFYKLEEKDKESLHLAMPFNFPESEIHYGNGSHTLRYGKDQLPGSNVEFICVEDQLELHAVDSLRLIIRCPKVALFEVGALMDETKTNGAKTWKTSPQAQKPLFLYVLNNYWHTNYKARQSGRIEFELTLNVIMD